MIPKLYASTETAFTSEGLGRLTDATRCEVTEERNGIYELVLEYPVGGPMINKIQVGRYIGATHDDDWDVQPFEIYKVSAPIRGVVTVNAWHISYKLNSVAVLPFTADSCANALAAIGTNSLNTNPFTFWTDKAVTAPFELTVPKNARNILGGEAGSILDVYGKGEYEFDKYTVKLWTNRGADNGVEIRYGKNLTALDYQQNGASVYNAVAPFWANDSTTVYLDHLVVRTGETAGNAIALDLSGEFDEEPTAAQLEAAAQAYIDASDNYEIKENIKVDFYPIWEADERYEAEQVRLCDTVTIIFEGYNIRAKAKAIKVVYDTLRDRYKYIELGEPKATFAQEVTALVSDNIMGSVEGLVKRTAADAIPDASTTERGLVNTGDQTFAGKKTFNTSPRIASGSSDLAWLILLSGGTAGVEYHGYKNNYGGRAYIVETSGKSDGTGSTGCYERYFLPTPDPDRTSSVDYGILTSKEPVTIARGGTGQTGQTAQQSYTPTVKIGTTAQTVSSLSAYYKSWGLMKLIGGRFNLTTTGTGQLIISLPTGFTVPTSAVQPMGILIAPDQKAYHIRVTADGLAAMSNGGSSVAWATGYYCFWAVVMGN